MSEIKIEPIATIAEIMEAFKVGESKAKKMKARTTSHYGKPVRGNVTLGQVAIANELIIIRYNK